MSSIGLLSAYVIQLIVDKSGLRILKSLNPQCRKVHVGADQIHVGGGGGGGGNQAAMQYAIEFIPCVFYMYIPL